MLAGAERRSVEVEWERRQTKIIVTSGKTTSTQAENKSLHKVEKKTTTAGDCDNYS